MGAVGLGAVIGVVVWQASSDTVEAESASEERRAGIRAILNHELHDLGDSETRQRFQDEGFLMEEDQVVHFKVFENPTTGFQWIPKEGMCDGVVKITESFDPPAAVSEEEGQMAGAGGTKYYSVVGLDEGNCDFQIAYARFWEFSWEENGNDE